MAWTSAGGKGHMLPSLFPGYPGDVDYPSWTWDPTSGEDLTKGATTVAQPGHPLPWVTTRNPEVLSAATQSLPDTGEGLDRGCVCARAYAQACVLRSEDNLWSILLPPHGP